MTEIRQQPRPYDPHRLAHHLDSVILSGLQESGLSGPKLDWVQAHCECLFTHLSNELKGELAQELKRIALAAETLPNHTFLTQSNLTGLFLSMTIIRGLTRDNIGTKGLKEHVLPHEHSGETLVFVANQRAWTDSAAICHVMEELAHERIVEVACKDTFPSAVARGLFQGGRLVVHTPMTVKESFRSPLETLSGSPFQALCAAMRAGKWPLLFPEALSISHLSSFELSRQRLENVREIFPFSPHLFAPWLSDDLATCGVDADGVSFVPVKILNSEGLPLSGNFIPNEEFDTIVKFGKPIPLLELKEQCSHLDEEDASSAAALLLQQRVVGLGENYLD